LLVSLAAAGCTAPQTSVRTQESRPALAITGAPATSQLYLDGNLIGDPNAYNGAPAVLRVEPGTHEVEVRDPSGKVIFRQRTFVESETKTIEVH
jgi:hypothetical protein